MSALGLYILDGLGNPVECDDSLEWGRWFQDSTNRRVAFDNVGGVTVSTVFLGIDHAFGGQPILFETMIFGGAHDQEQWRYSSRAGALRGHAEAVALVRSSQT